MPSENTTQVKQLCKASRNERRLSTLLLCQSNYFVFSSQDMICQSNYFVFSTYDHALRFWPTKDYAKTEGAVHTHSGRNGSILAVLVDLNVQKRGCKSVGMDGFACVP